MNHTLQATKELTECFARGTYFEHALFSTECCFCPLCLLHRFIKYVACQVSIIVWTNRVYNTSDILYWSKLINSQNCMCLSWSNTSTYQCHVQFSRYCPLTPAAPQQTARARSKQINGTMLKEVHAWCCTSIYNDNAPYIEYQYTNNA